MAACCETKSAPTRQEFLTTKLRNFRTFLEPYCVTEDLQAKLTVYDSLDAVMPWLLQGVAAVRLGQTEAVVSRFCEPFGAAATDDFRTRVRRTIQMFADVLA